LFKNRKRTLTCASRKQFFTYASLAPRN